MYAIRSYYVYKAIMQTSTQNSIFSNALGIKRNDVVAIIGSGGKTSLMFRLAWEGMTLGLKVLVTTSTKIFIPRITSYNVCYTKLLR